MSYITSEIYIFPKIFTCPLCELGTEFTCPITTGYQTRLSLHTDVITCNNNMVAWFNWGLNYEPWKKKQLSWLQPWSQTHKYKYHSSQTINQVFITKSTTTYPANLPDLESARDPPGRTGPNGSNLAPGGTAPLWQSMCILV